MSNLVRVIVPKESGNPRSTDSVRRQGEGFLIEVFIEDDNPYYRCRLDVELVNDSSEPVSVPLVNHKNRIIFDPLIKHR